MLKEPFTEKFYTYRSKYIENILALRQPQRESLEIFAKLCDILTLSKEPNLADELKAVQSFCPTLKSFERNFPSFCFALATGIGKTRLIGACIAYLRYEKGIKNFFVMAPNLTIYDKLKSDLGNPANPKYVFRGLDLFVKPPRIIDGDNYDYFQQLDVFTSDVTINVFNIAKLNAESKGKKGEPARIKRLNEVLGTSYFEYLQSLPDLCIFMDESHHYHADRSFEVINDLQPILGVELTATPQIQKGTKAIPFKNVVYEYSLAHALKDKQYVKIPTVFTRKDFHSEEYTPEQLDHEKLNDGLLIHEETKSQLEIYARNNGKPIVKPFVLIVARDTDHSKKLLDYIKSENFFKGYYADKVMEINSDLKKAERDENIKRLLALEKPENKIEIVIHVNMLKEGWDVTNLYTIIPLRASASETLTEQTIGRGLRLPYGVRTGIDTVDRLSIVSHDKYEAIINLANSPDSLIQKVYYIDDLDSNPNCAQRETIELPAAYEIATNNADFTNQLSSILQTENSTYSQANEIAKFVANYTSKTVMNLNRQVKTFADIHNEKISQAVKRTVINETNRLFPDINLKTAELENAVEKAIATCVQELTNRIIPIPKTIIQPSTEVKQIATRFTLNTSSMKWYPANNILLGTELQEGGKTFEVQTNSIAADDYSTENEIAQYIIAHDNIEYTACADLIYSLINDAKQHFLTYLTIEETTQVMRERQKTIADIIYSQMNTHLYQKEIKLKATKMRPFSHILTEFGYKFKTDDIYDLRANIPASEVQNKIFKGFFKACHTLYKFDSNTERTFAIILENDKDVLKWLRPAAKQFDIYYNLNGVHRYEPDFIVETADTIYMIETKASNEIDSETVVQKAKAAKIYCQTATKWNTEHGGKPWQYAIISHDEVKLNSSFEYLIKNSFK